MMAARRRQNSCVRRGRVRLSARPAWRAQAGTVPGVLVSDLSHFLHLHADTRPGTRSGPGSSAASCGQQPQVNSGTAWNTALPCWRRPGHRPRADRITVCAGRG